MASDDSPVDVSVALAPNDAAAVPGLVKAINEGAAALAAAGGSNDTAVRHNLLVQARSLMQALETPRETMVKHCWGETGALGALSFGVDSGLWKLMAKKAQKDGDAPQKVGELAAELGIDPPLLSRLMRHLGAMGYLKEVGVDEYVPTNQARAMSLDIIGNGYIAMLTGSGAAALQFHEFARERGWKTPTDASDTSFHRAYKTKLNFFERQHEQGYGQHFNHHMAGYRQGRLPWCDPAFYPVAERLIAGHKPETALLVDQGGSIGHDISEFHRYFPDVPQGSLVLEDLPAVIKDLPAAVRDIEAIRPLEHDFLTPQPVKGARAYYMHSCLHDWPDNVCETILKQLKGAMTPGYSKILINENVIPQRDAWWETTALDMVMLTCFSSLERTERDWYHLIEEMAGLKIVKIYTAAKGTESLIEVELVAN